MGIKRIVDTSFWTDDKVMDKFSPEDKLFMLYLMTNPHTTQLGIYQINLKYMALELGYSQDTIRVLLDRFETKYKIIKYSYKTQEIAIKNYLKYSIVKGGKPVEDCLIKEIKLVKDKSLLGYIYKNIFDYENLNQTVDKIIHLLNQNDNEYDNENDNDNDVSYNDTCNDTCNDTLPTKLSNVFITIITNTKEEYPIEFNLVTQYKELYPNVDVEQELKKMKAWSISNPSKRKTKRGMLKFVNNWLSREQDKPKFNSNIRKEVEPNWLNEKPKPKEETLEDKTSKLLKMYEVQLKCNQLDQAQETAKQYKALTGKDIEEAKKELDEAFNVLSKYD
jgi:hypothetical protein